MTMSEYYEHLLWRSAMLKREADSWAAAVNEHAESETELREAVIELMALRRRQERQERRCRWIGSLLRALTPPEKSPAAVSHQSNGPEPDSGTSQCGSEASLLPESRP